MGDSLSKRTFIIFIAVLLLVFATACSGQGNDDPNPSGTIGPVVTATVEAPPTPSPTPNYVMLIGKWTLEGVGEYEFKDDGMLYIHFSNGNTNEIHYVAEDSVLTFTIDDMGNTTNSYTIIDGILTLKDEAGAEYSLSRIN